MFKTHFIVSAKRMVNKEVHTGGWVHEIRNLGKIKFILLRDLTGIVQVTAKKDEVGEDVLRTIEKLGKEFVISVRGKVRENPVAPDGVEIVPSKVELLSEVLKKLPVDPTGVVPSDLDTRLTYRYIDLRRKEILSIFKIRAEAARLFRERAIQLGFVEITPPAIVVASTEGGADLFPIEYFERKAYLAQSPQLYKQLVVAGGMEKVFMTHPVFRAEKHHTTVHLNESTQMDVEIGFADEQDAMDVLEDIFIHILKNVKNMKEELLQVGSEITVPKKVNRYTYTEAIDLLRKHHSEIKWGMDFSREEEKKLSEILGEECYFVHQWPTDIRAFYSMPNEDRKTCRAFDLMYRGLEIASGAQRIHIPELLIQQLKKRGLDPYNFEFYIDGFRFGAPPHAGWSIGLDRLTMKLTNKENIRECVLFPRDRTRLHP